MDSGTVAAVDDGPAFEVRLDGGVGEVDQSQTGDVHTAIRERRHRHLADALHHTELTGRRHLPR